MTESLKVLICCASLHVTIKILAVFFSKPCVCQVLPPPAVASRMKATMGFSLLLQAHHFLELVHLGLFVPIVVWFFFFNYGFVVYMACWGCERNDVFHLSVNKLKAEPQSVSFVLFFRLIYFGGYGCRRHNELQDCFDVHDASWVRE